MFFGFGSKNSPEKQSRPPVERPFHYDATEQELDEAENYADKRSISFGQACDVLGIKKIYDDVSNEKTGSVERASNTQSSDYQCAQLALKAISRILSASQKEGMLSANASSHPKFSGYNQLTNKVIRQTEGSMSYQLDNAEEPLAAALNSQAVRDILSRYTKKVSSITVHDLYRAFTGKENESNRTQARKELSKIS